MLKANLLRASGGIEPNSVFKILSYGGSGSVRTLTTGLDSTTKESLAWFKSTSNTASHTLFDTLRTTGSALATDDSAGASTVTAFSAWLSTGISFSSGEELRLNRSGLSYVLWQFLKERGFFDIVTYTGNGSARTIAHDLGTVPGMIIIKRYDTNTDWPVWHNSLADSTKYLLLDSTNGLATNSAVWDSTAPTSSVLSLGTSSLVNASGGGYIAYLFGNEGSTIKCGSYTGNGSLTGPTVTLNFKPQFLMIKAINGAAESWFIFDSVRNTVNPRTAALRPNLSTSTFAAASVDFTSSGFQPQTDLYINNVGVTYVYMAIREA